MGPWLALVGDMVPMRRPLGMDSRLVDILRSAQLTFANLETPLTLFEEAAEKAFYHRADPVQAQTLVDLGIDLVTLANNHTLDFGQIGLADTVAALHASGIATVGAGNNFKEAIAAHRGRTEKGSIGALGLSSALPPGFAAGSNRPGVAPIRVLQNAALDTGFLAEQPGMAPFIHTDATEGDVEAACEVIRSMRQTVDLLVVGIHWGIPYGFAAPSYGILAEYQRSLAHALIDAGADIVAGHHPHYVQPIEVYRNRLVLYSLGNFMFHNWNTLTRSAESKDIESELDLTLPAAPYRNAMSADATEESVILTVDPTAFGLAVRFIPSVMSDGDPKIPNRDRAAHILDRLTAPRLPFWQGGDTPKINVIDDDHLNTLIGELYLETTF